MSARRGLCLSVALWAAFAARAQDPAYVAFEIDLERDGDPGFNADPAIDGERGSEYAFTAKLVIATSRIRTRGIQGWSLSVGHGGVEIDSISIDGTASAERSEGGFSDRGYLKHEIVPSSGWNEGRKGVVQAVILSFLSGDAVLPPNTRQVVAKSLFRGTVDVSRTAFVGYDDGLRGSGQPVLNNATYFGTSIWPVVSVRNIRIAGGGLPEICDDGIDNDGDERVDCVDTDCPGEGWWCGFGECRECGISQCSDGFDNDRDGRVDCADSRCRGRPGCVEICGDGEDNDANALADCDDPGCWTSSGCTEVCDDGEDNNRNGQTDCQDPQCWGFAECVEICDDGVDNDGNGQVDCEDPRCEYRPICFEVCYDGVDNDADGFLDCADPDCRDNWICSEDCDDGIDNNGNGRVDCLDPACSVNWVCVGPEICGDAVDNDLDFQVDCWDTDCEGVAPCLFREDCANGIDDNGNGLIDCGDPTCWRDVVCREDCGDGVDNDMDGSVDCDDTNCWTDLACAKPEVCNDWFDNDRDGRTDCADPDCAGVPPCPEPEDCSNGVDDDDDGRIDCADRDCRGRPQCPPDENCCDFFDNDRDGLIDFADPDCEDVRSCGSGGFDYVIFSEGAKAEETGNVVDVEYEGQTSVPVTVYIVPNPAPQTHGAQGWSLSIAHDEDAMDIDPESPPTVEGTDAGELRSGGFEKTEVVERPPTRPGDGGGAGSGGGFVSAVVLSFTQPMTLDPSRAQSIARAGYVVRDSLGTGGSSRAAVRFEDALQGSGQPVSNVLTVEGRTVKPLRLVPLEVRRVTLGGPFVRGDSNGDAKVNLADAVWCVNELVRKGPRTECPRAADVNADGYHDLSDVVYLIEWGFRGGPAIPDPFPECGTAVGPIDLDCPEGSVSHCR